MTNEITEKIDTLIASKPSLRIADGRNIPSFFKISDKGWLFIAKDEKTPQLVTTTPPFIKEQYIDIETGQHSYAIEFMTQGRKKEIEVRAEQITQYRKVRELASLGLDVDDNNARNVMKFLTEYRRYNKIPILSTAGRLGHINKHFVSPRGNDTKIITTEAGYSSLLKAFQSKGNLQSYCEKVFKLIKNKEVVMSIVYGAVGSVFLHDLGQEPFAIDMSGKTSTGKSTSLMIACSVWGNQSLKLSWNITNVAMERYATFLNSFPLILDDTKDHDKSVIPKMIYQFSSGQSKARGNTTDVNAQKTWKNILLSSGEESMLDFGKEHGGLSARTIAIEIPPFVDGYNYEPIYSGFLNNYGQLGFKCLEVFNENKEKYKTIFDDSSKRYIKRANNNPVLIRLARSYSVLAVAGAVINDIKGFEHDYINNVDFIFNDMLKNNKTVDKPTELLSDLLEMLDSDRSGIVGEGYNHIESKVVTAIYRDEFLGITTKTVRGFLNEGYKTVTKEWREKGYLYNCNKDERQKSVRMNGKLHRCYTIDTKIINQLGYDFKVDSYGKT